MIAYLARRLLWIVLTMFAVSMLTFGLVFTKGDPAVLLVPTRPGQAPDPVLVERVRRERGLDKPVPVQYVTYLGHLVRGDLGYSYLLRRPVKEVLFEKFPNTALLAAAIVVVALALGLPIGMIAAVYRNSLVDRTLLVYNTTAVAIPSFLLALLLLYFVAFRWQVLPFEGSPSPRRLILPTLSVAIPSAAAYAIFLRSNLLNQVTADYVRTARAKGLRERLVVTRHMLRNALIPLVTLVSIDMAYLLTGIVLVEQVFGYPGIGSQVLVAVRNKDIPVVMGSVFFGALLIGVGNLIADLTVARLDPRIRLR
jgi:peptide/nickel transport system permease protein